MSVKLSDVENNKKTSLFILCPNFLYSGPSYNMSPEHIPSFMACLAFLIRDLCTLFLPSAWIIYLPGCLLTMLQIFCSKRWRSVPRSKQLACLCHWKLAATLLSWAVEVDLRMSSGQECTTALHFGEESHAGVSGAGGCSDLARPRRGLSTCMENKYWAETDVRQETWSPCSVCEPMP